MPPAQPAVSDPIRPHGETRPGRRRPGRNSVPRRKARTRSIPRSTTVRRRQPCGTSIHRPPRWMRASAPRPNQSPDTLPFPYSAGNRLPAKRHALRKLISRRGIALPGTKAKTMGRGTNAGRPAPPRQALPTTRICERSSVSARFATGNTEGATAAPRSMSGCLVSKMKL